MQKLMTRQNYYEEEKIWLMNGLYKCYIKIHELYKLLYPLVNICFSDFLQSIRAKFLDTKRSHCRSDNDCRFHIFEGDIFCLSKMTDKTTRKCIAGARWIKYFL